MVLIDLVPGNSCFGRFTELIGRTSSRQGRPQLARQPVKLPHAGAAYPGELFIEKSQADKSTVHHRDLIRLLASHYVGIIVLPVRSQPSIFFT